MDITTWLQQEAEAAVRRGKAVREEIARAVAAVSDGALRVGGGFIDLARSTVQGAAKGVATAAAAESARTLRAVVDGIGDGLTTTAQAAKLTLQEAAGGAARFAREDLDKMSGDFRTLGESFVDVVESAATRAGGHAAAQAAELRAHAVIALRRAQPAFEAAIDAARQDPTGLARQTLAAGAGATRGALGALFTALGAKLQSLGGRLAPDDDAGPPDS